MKILRFHFSTEPNMKAPVDTIKKKFRSRTWILRHLGHRRFRKDELFRVYLSVILPVHDYCSSIYNSCLTQQQVNELERLQAQALKSIYGYEHLYRELLAKTRLDTLKARRDKKSDRFAAKAATGHFRHWFPLQQASRGTRSTDKYEEFFARTKRPKKSPLYFMRRRLNGKPS